jgi:hypothetical protein
MYSLEEMLPSLLLVFCAFGLSYGSKRLTGSWFSPVSCLAVPFGAIVLTHSLIGQAMGLQPLHVDAVLWWLSGTAVFSVTGLFIVLAFDEKLGTMPDLLLEGGDDRFALRSLKIVAVPVLILMIVGNLLGLSQSEGVSEMGSEVHRSIAGSGVFGKAQTFGMVAVMIFLGAARKVLSLEVLLAFCFTATAIVYGVKGWIYLPLIGGLVYRFMTNRVGLSIATVVGVPAIAALVYFSVYYLRGYAKFGDLALDEAYSEFLTDHFVNYVFAGVLAHSEGMRLGLLAEGAGNPIWPFQSIVVIIDAFFGFQGDLRSALFSTSAIEVVTGAKGTTSNVYNFFGHLWFHLGTFWAVVSIMGISATLHLIFVMLKMYPSSWLLLIWVFYASMLCFAWFDSYFYLLAMIEIPISIAIVSAGNLLRRRIQLDRSHIIFSK